MEHTEKSMKEEMGSRRRASHQPHSHSVTDAGREIVHAFEMNWSPTPCVTEKLEAEDVKYCYYLLEDMPLPGPTWSTTGPSVLVEPLPAPPIEASLGLDWGENQASSASYRWWLGFLEGLDDGSNMTTEKLDIPFVENINVMENCKGLSHESKLLDAIDLGCCPDDWLVIPGMEKDLGDMP